MGWQRRRMNDMDVGASEAGKSLWDFGLWAVNPGVCSLP